MKYRLPTIAACMLLAACGHVNFDTTFVGVATHEVLGVAKYYTYTDRGSMLTTCVDHDGVITQDGQACVIIHRDFCIQMRVRTIPDTSARNKELNAICNGWRPALFKPRDFW